MSGILQLIGLLAVVLLVSAALEDQRRGVVPAGVYVLIGVLAGPLGLALLDEDLQPLLRPLISICISWLALLFGFRLRAGALKRLGWRGGVAVIIETAFVMMAVATGLQWVAPALKISLTPVAILGIAIATAASSRATIRFARTHFHAQGKLTSFLETLTGADDLPAIVALVVLAVLFPAAAAATASPSLPWALAVGTIGLGLVLGLVFALAAGRGTSDDIGWLILMGVTFLGAGVSSRLGLPEIAVGCLVGLAVAQTAEGRFLVGIVASTERPVTLLLLVLVGASLVPGSQALIVAAVVIGLRFIAKLLSGPLIAPLGAVPPAAGLGLLGYGGLALATAAQISLLYGGSTGELVLIAAAVQSVVGDVLGPTTLKLVLQRSGELAASKEAADG